MFLGLRFPNIQSVLLSWFFNGTFRMQNSTKRQNYFSKAWRISEPVSMLLVLMLNNVFLFTWRLPKGGTLKGKLKF